MLLAEVRPPPLRYKTPVWTDSADSGRPFVLEGVVDVDGFDLVMRVQGNEPTQVRRGGQMDIEQCEPLGEASPHRMKPYIIPIQGMGMRE